MSGRGRYAARRARNAAWLHVYRDLWWLIAEAQGIGYGALDRGADDWTQRYHRTHHTAHKLAGLARVCARRGVR